MPSEVSNLESPTVTIDPPGVLETLAQHFVGLWPRAEGEEITGCARLSGDMLLLSLRGVLTEEQVAQAATEDGYAVVVRDVSATLDRLYSPLAEAIERGLHCQVGAMQVELDAQRRAVHVQLHLREAPGLWRLATLDTRCGE